MLGAKARGRIDAVDWLRGLAVVLMIQTHLYDAWCSPAAKATAAYGWTRFLGGIPSRLFLLIVGVAMAIRYESQIARQVDRATMVRTAAKRGGKAPRINLDEVPDVSPGRSGELIALDDALNMLAEFDPARLG